MRLTAGGRLAGQGRGRIAHRAAARGPAFRFRVQPFQVQTTIETINPMRHQTQLEHAGAAGSGRQCLKLVGSGGIRNVRWARSAEWRHT